MSLSVDVVCVRRAFMSLRRVALRFFGTAMLDLSCSSVAESNQSRAIRDVFDIGKDKTALGCYLLR
jgi:hypothetical protein